MARKTKGSKVVAIRKQGTARPAKDGSLADAAYIALKEKIVRLFFLPGQYLNEGALCELLGVGRTPVHQALQRLQHDGLVEVMPRKGVIVQPGSISEILKILDSRVTIEADLARNAASRVTAEQAAELKKLARVKVTGDSRSQLDNFVEADRAFRMNSIRLAEHKK